MADNNYSDDIKWAFIESELAKHGRWLEDELRAALRQRRMNRSGDLSSSIDSDTFLRGDAPVLGLNLLDYGRFVDIRSYRVNLRTVRAANKQVNRELWGIRENRSGMKKRTRWYARNMYGGLNTLISRIMYGLTDAEAERLKTILQNKNS